MANTIVEPWMMNAAEDIYREFNKVAGSSSWNGLHRTTAQLIAQHAPAPEATAEHVRELVKAARAMKDGYECGDELCGYIKPLLSALAHFEEGRDGK